MPKYTISVLGLEVRRSPGAMLRGYEETWEIQAEHPQPAIEHVLNEIEWGILDAEETIRIRVVPEASDQICHQVGHARRVEVPMTDAELSRRGL